MNGECAKQHPLKRSVPQSAIEKARKEKTTFWISYELADLDVDADGR